jgi:hypothetical protein
MNVSALCLALIAAVPCTGCMGCGPSKHSGRADTAAAEAVVTGTCVDAETGEHLAGAKIEVPGGKSAVSGRDGRFEIRGLHAGDDGEITARMQDGRAARNPLRPLQPGTLEVVLRLAFER